MGIEKPGRRVVGIVGTHSKEYIDAVFAALNAGDIAVTLRGADDRERIEASAADVVVEPGSTTGWIDLPSYTGAEGSGYAQLLFTSGTEGVPKGILLTHDNLRDTTERLISVMEIDAGIWEYVGIPVYFSFGFGRVRVLSRVGGRCYLPPAGFSPVEIADMLGSGQINALSAVPTLLRLILQERELYAQCGKRLKWLEIGSQYMSGEEKQAIRALFPNARIVQHYGLTEASRSTFLKIHEAGAAQLESVGRCYGDAACRLAADGRIQVKGPHVARTMLVDGEEKPVTDAEGWLTTSDLGHCAGEFLYFDGRADDMINCGGVKISPDCLQKQIDAALGCDGAVAVARIPDPFRGDGVLVAYRRAAGLDPKSIQACTEAALHSARVSLRSATVYFPVDELPVTETGKLQRKRLCRLYLDTAGAERPAAAVEGAAASSAPAGSASLTERLVAIWEETLNVRPISVHDSFVDLGGDSLSAISISVKMERSGIPQSICQQILRGRTIAEIVDSVEGDAGPNATAVTAKSIDITRGLLVLAVIAAHWMPGFVEHLSAGIRQFNRFLAPFYTAGTPGFAIIFGVGVGFFLLPRFRKHPATIGRMVRKNATILFIGLACLATIRVLSYVAQDQPIVPMAVANAFWSVITYYLLAVLSLPLWLRVLARYAAPLLPCLFFAALFFGVHIFITDVIAPAPSSNALVQMLILIGTAKYNYFEMSAGALSGAAIGVWYRDRLAAGQGIAHLFPIGMLAVLLSILMSREAGGMSLWFTWPRAIYLWTWCFYVGVVILLIHWIHRLLSAEAGNRNVESVLNGLAILGVMAFPMFIGHEMVLPLRDLLQGIGLPAPLLVAMLLFLVPAGYLMVKLYRFYYSNPVEAFDYSGLEVKT